MVTPTTKQLRDAITEMGVFKRHGQSYDEIMYKNTVQKSEEEIPSIAQIRMGMTKDEMAKDAQDMGLLGIKRVVFPDPEMLAHWRQRIAALR